MSLAIVSELDKFQIFRTLGYKPHASQLEVHRSEAPRRVVVWGTRAGKTKAAAHEAVAASVQPSAIDRPIRGWCVAPNYDLCDKVFREIHLLVMTKLRPLVIQESESERRILLRNLGGGLSEVRGKTAENPDSLMGEGLDWVIADECAAMRPKIWDRFLQARLLDKQGWALLISTPRGKGWYYDAYRKGQVGSSMHSERWQSWRLPTHCNPHLSREELKQLELETPDLIWRQEYLAEFLDGVGQVFRNVRDLAVLPGFIQPMHTIDGLPDPHRTYCAGLDLAKTVDYTVLIIVDDLRQVVFVDRFARLDWSIQGQRLAATLERYGNPPCLVDSTGAGEPIYEALLALGVNAKPYVFSNPSKNAIVNNLALSCERRDIALPREDICPQLVDEMESFEYSLTETGKVKTGAPSGYNDDTVSALALACWELGSRAYFSDEPLED